MQKYAVIKVNGSQYRVSEGDELLVDRSKKVEPEVLLIVDGGDIKIGKPFIKEGKIKVSVLGDEKGDKIVVQKYKAKSRYRKKIGFRASYTKIKIDKITS